MTDTSNIMRELGSIGARLQTLETRQSGVETKLGEVHDSFQRLEGGKKVALWVIGGVSAAVGGVTAALASLTGTTP